MFKTLTDAVKSLPEGSRLYLNSATHPDDDGYHEYWKTPAGQLYQVWYHKHGAPGYGNGPLWSVKLITGGRP